MVHLISNLTSIVAAAAPIKIMDVNQAIAINLSEAWCNDFVPVIRWPESPGALNEQWTLTSSKPGLYTIQSVACGTTVTWAGDNAGVGAIHSQAVAKASTGTQFQIIPVDPSHPQGPFAIIESSSGLSLTAWAYDSTFSSSALTFESTVLGDGVQSFYIVNA